MSTKLLLVVFVALLVGCGGSGSTSSGGASATVNSNGGTGLGSTHPNVTINISRRLYTVSGTTISQLRRELQQKGPGSFFGRVVSTISYDYRTRGNCALARADVGLRSVLILPQWTPPPGTHASTVAEWRRFVAALEAHEINHLRIDIAESEALARSLLSLQPQPTCEQLVERMEQLHKDTIARASKRNESYDDRTNHGRSEGAYL